MREMKRRVHALEARAAPDGSAVPTLADFYAGCWTDEDLENPSLGPPLSHFYGGRTKEMLAR